jgi:capsular exopolysaccharide synthesis family protein
MEIKRYFEIVKIWWWLVVTCALLAGGAAYLVSMQMTPVYEATATLLINQTNSVASTDLAALTISERLATTYGELLKKRPLMEETIAELGLDTSPKTLVEQVDVTPVRGTQLIDVAVRDNDPALAVALVDKLTQLFIDNTQEMSEGRRTEAKASLEAQINSLESEIATLETDLATMGEPIDEYDRLKVARMEDTLLRYRSNWSSLLESYQQIVLAAAQSVDSVVVVEPPHMPELPVSPQKMRNTLLALVLGAMLGLGAAFLVEYLDDSVKTSQDVERAIGLPTLGAIGEMRMDGDEEILVAVEHPRATVSEALRVLRSNIQFLSVDRPLRTILVTSAWLSEGKSITVANLAAVMAQAGASVILVDADLRRPRQQRIFRKDQPKGLTNLLMDANFAAHLDDYLQPTPVENLRLLTAGPIPPNPADLLQSKRMETLIGQLLEKAEVVLFDSPPTLVAADASLLAAKIDGTLLVAVAGDTPQPLLQQAQQALGAAGGRILGVVLNRVSQRASGYYYYYSQYYGGDGPSDGNARHRRKQLAAPPTASPLGAVRAISRRLWPAEDK